MALLAKISIINPLAGTSFSPGDVLTINYTSMSGITVLLNGSPYTGAEEIGTSVLKRGSSSVNFKFIGGISSSKFGYAISSYSYCDGDDLKWFRVIHEFPSFPYAEQQTTTDSPVCASGGGAVCDIHFDGPLSISHATNQSGNNGAVTASALSTNGNVKYGLSDFNYQFGGQTSGTFTGLTPGGYTMWAKDENDCTITQIFKVLFKSDYVEHYRFTWDKMDLSAGNDRTSRLRIYEREYAGDLVEIEKGDNTPFVLNKPKAKGEINDKFAPIHKTNGVISFHSQVNYQFLPLFTQDNKKFKVVYEIDEGSGFIAKWSGFIEPSVYNEPFVPAPYPVSISVTDAVITLENELFVDDAGNSITGKLNLIDIITLIMKKTGLSLQIKCGVNIFEENHDDDPEDDPFFQTDVDTECYRDADGPFNCIKVLESILRPFGAKLYQYENQWIIEEIDRAADGYNYRIFDTNGDYVSNGSFDPIIEIVTPEDTDGMILQGPGQNLEVIPAYGKISVIMDLNYIGSIRGGFEKEDLLSPDSEEFDLVQGVFTSEEGFRNWTLRLNGNEGVSFGRVDLGTRVVGNIAGLSIFALPKSPGRSAGAFFFDPESWSGNLRDSYIESSALPYQYGPGDSIKLSFDYSTPSTSSYDFSILRVLVKLGDKYLQPNGSWDTTESIFRSYPKAATSLQNFQIEVPVPDDTDEVVDSTIQVRVYFYSQFFYDYGLPSSTGDVSDGTDGMSALKALATTGINFNYRVDVNDIVTIAGTSSIRRFFEIRNDVDDTNLAALAAQEALGYLVVPIDYDGATNPTVWWQTSQINDTNNNLNTNQLKGPDLKFFIDNVKVDSVINGQEPPKTQTVDIEINKYINENLEVTIYNGDCPDITNAKNMYNNYFRLSDGTPTSQWHRSGVDEKLKLQEILLKVIGSNHSAPTSRITGTLVNAFSVTGLNNYLQITKPESDISISNGSFTSDISGWTQIGSGESFVWDSDNSGSAQVTLSGVENSKKFYQAINHNGGYVRTTVNVHVIPGSDNNREDVLWLLMLSGSDIVQTEKLKTFTAISSESDHDFTYVSYIHKNITGIGFYLQRVSGSSDCTYQIGRFLPQGTDIEEIYQITDYSFDDYHSLYRLELMQISKHFLSLNGVDIGGTNQGSNTQGSNTDGSPWSGAYSADYGGGFSSTFNGNPKTKSLPIKLIPGAILIK